MRVEMRRFMSSALLLLACGALAMKGVDDSGGAVGGDRAGGGMFIGTMLSAGDVSSGGVANSGGTGSGGVSTGLSSSVVSAVTSLFLGSLLTDGRHFPASPPIKGLWLPIQSPPLDRLPGDTDRFPWDASQDKEYADGNPDGLMGYYTIHDCPQSRNGEGLSANVIDVAEFNFLLLFVCIALHDGGEHNPPCHRSQGRSL